MNPSKVLRQWLYWTAQGHHKQPLAITLGKGREGGSDVKDSLLGGEVILSDGTKNHVAHHHRQVPKGFLAVYVGPEQRRFVIPMSCLSMPEFRGLMDRAAEEFGFQQEEGGLQIPCEEQDFEEILVRCLRSQKMSKTKKYIHDNIV